MNSPKSILKISQKKSKPHHFRDQIMKGDQDWQEASQDYGDEEEENASFDLMAYTSGAKRGRDH